MKDRNAEIRHFENRLRRALDDYHVCTGVHQHRHLETASFCASILTALRHEPPVEFRFTPAVPKHKEESIKEALAKPGGPATPVRE